MSRGFFNFFFVLILFLIALSFAWDYLMFQDCLADGKAAYQCNALVNHNRSVMIQNITE